MALIPCALGHQWAKFRGVDPSTDLVTDSLVGRLPYTIRRHAAVCTRRHIVCLMSNEPQAAKATRNWRWYDYDAESLTPFLILKPDGTMMVGKNEWGDMSLGILLNRIDGGDKDARKARLPIAKLQEYLDRLTGSPS